MKFHVKNEEVTFIICRSMKKSSELKSISVVNHIVESGYKVSIKERLGIDALTVVMINFDTNDIEDNA